MFFSLISKDTLNQIMTLFFKNMGYVDSNVDLEITDMLIRGDEVEVTAEVKEETLQ